MQALYQMDLAGTDLDDVIDEFRRTCACRERRSDERGRRRRSASIFAARAAAASCAASARSIRWSTSSSPQAGAWCASTPSCAPSCAPACFELMELPDVPARVVINEYIKVANAFFEGDEPKVVNGVLDKLARKLRAGELPERGVTVVIPEFAREYPGPSREPQQRRLSGPGYAPAFRDARIER